MKMRLIILTFIVACTFHAFADTVEDSDSVPFLEKAFRSNASEGSGEDINNNSSQSSSSESYFHTSREDYSDSSSKSTSNSSSEYSSSSWYDSTTSVNDDMEALTRLFNKETSSTSKEIDDESISDGSSQASSSRTISGRQSTVFSTNSTSSEYTSVTSDGMDAVLGTRKPVPLPKTIIQKSIEWMSDAYTLSIMLPIAAGIVFAAMIIVTVATCTCIRRRCRRRRIRKKILPDSVKSMRPSDRARLLADTSDEEF